MSIITVSELNNYLSFKINSDSMLKGIMLTGEISNFMLHYKSGHIYFTLKDNNSSIKCVMFSSNAKKLKFIPEDGMNVIIYGNCELYSKDSACQIIVSDIQIAGIGQLYIAFEQLKLKLNKEGMFDDIHKKTLPLYPSVIAVITSVSGAAIHDIENVLKRRYPICTLLVFNSIMQGKDTAESVCRQLSNAIKYNPDVIIISRGGGSYEDLYEFNSEKLARAVYNCPIPVISAIGHEVDNTILDYVADYRASTPSAAAEIVAPEIKSIFYQIDNLQNELKNSIKYLLDKKQKEINIINDKLQSASPEKYIEHYLKQLDNIDNNLKTHINFKFNFAETNLVNQIKMLNSCNPLNILERGYSLTYKDSRLIKNSKDLNVGDNINIRFKDSDVVAVVKEIK